jgi:invasion protein IalB
MTRLYLLVVFFLILCGHTARAQEPSKPGTEADPAPGWVTKCTSGGRRTALDCSVEQTVLLKKTQQLLLSVVVRVPPDSREPAMMIHLPFGLFLPAGITLDLEGQKRQQLEVQTCDSKGCYAGTVVSGDMLAAMKQSEQLTVTFQDLPKNNISIQVPLKGFAAAYQRIE